MTLTSLTVGVAGAVVTWLGLLVSPKAVWDTLAAAMCLVIGFIVGLSLAKAVERKP